MLPFGAQRRTRLEDTLRARDILAPPTPSMRPAPPEEDKTPDMTFAFWYWDGRESRDLGTGQDTTRGHALRARERQDVLCFVVGARTRVQMWPRPRAAQGHPRIPGTSLKGILEVEGTHRPWGGPKLLGLPLL